jgi:hypothetical protein
MDVNLDALITPPRKITLGGRLFEIEDIKLGQSFRVLAMYNQAQDMLAGDGLQKIIKDEKYALKYLNCMIDVCIKIVRPKFTIKWFKLIGVNRYWFYKHTNKEQLTSFVKEVMRPLLSDDKEKKKKQET